MKEFFLDKEIGIPFACFTFPHLICLAILFIGITLTYLNQDKLPKTDNKTKNKVRIIMATVLLINRFIYMGSYIYYGVYDWKVHLPIHFCFITGYLFIAYLFTKKEWLYKLAYFFIFAGPLTATFWPDLKSSFDYYVFYEFFISHHMLFIFMFIIFYMDNIKMNIKDMWKAIIGANLIFLFAIIFNSIFGTNYIMSNKLPDHILGMYPFLKYLNPIFVLELAGSFFCSLGYFPIYLKNKKQKI